MNAIARRPAATSLTPREQLETEILERLAQGQSLTEISQDIHMPERCTIQRWINENPALDDAVTRAREIGFAVLAERAVIDAQNCSDPAKGRLKLDATRWYLGKLSNAFSDNKAREVKLDVQLSPEAEKWLGRT